jgi:hypothetical protein
VIFFLGGNGYIRVYTYVCTYVLRFTTGRVCLCLLFDVLRYMEWINKLDYAQESDAVSYNTVMIGSTSTASARISSLRGRDPEEIYICDGKLFSCSTCNLRQGKQSSVTSSHSTERWCTEMSYNRPGWKLSKEI